MIFQVCIGVFTQVTDIFVVSFELFFYSKLQKIPVKSCPDYFSCFLFIRNGQQGLLHVADSMQEHNAHGLYSLCILF